MKIKFIDEITKDEKDGNYSVSILIGKGSAVRRVVLEVLSSDVEKGEKDITSVDGLEGFWIYKGKLIQTDLTSEAASNQDLLHLKHFVLIKERKLKKIAKQVEVFEKFEEVEESRREQLSESVRLFVWRRDEGKCVKCGRKDKLEFDHIIPVAEGGSNTERNIQLLCETCNRSKGKSVV